MHLQLIFLRIGTEMQKTELELKSHEPKDFFSKCILIGFLNKVEKESSLSLPCCTHDPAGLFLCTCTHVMNTWTEKLWWFFLSNACRFWECAYNRVLILQCFPLWALQWKEISPIPASFKWTERMLTSFKKMAKHSRMLHSSCRFTTMQMHKQPIPFSQVAWRCCSFLITRLVCD